MYKLKQPVPKDNSSQTLATARACADAPLETQRPGVALPLVTSCSKMVKNSQNSSGKHKYNLPLIYMVVHSWKIQCIL